MSNKNEGEKKMESVTKYEDYKGLSLSPDKLNEITIHPKVKNGKVLFNSDNKDHRYLVEEGE